VGRYYSKTVTASGCGSPYSFIISSSSLPSGLTLTSSGFFSGTPTSAGNFAFEIQARDLNGCLGTRQYFLTVVWPTISLCPSTLPNGTMGHSYSKTITANSGIGPYSFTVSSCSLLAGLTLPSVGYLSGTPTCSGTFSFTIKAKDKNGFIGSRSYYLALAP